MQQTAPRKIVTASMIGNILEYYDFTLFGFLSPLLAPLFFPAFDPLTSLIAALATYGVGYFMRPLGAAFFGYVGDKYGRKRALSFSIILMSVPTVLIAFLPTYEQIGILAPIILILLRLLQGFCTGGEYNGAGIYVVENVNIKKAGFFGSLITISSAIGGLSANVVSSIVTLPLMPTWGWRLAFLVGGVIGGIGLYMRKKLPDNSLQEIRANNEVRPKVPLYQAITQHYRSMICTIGIAAFSGAMYNISFSYTSVFLSTHAEWHLSDSLFLMSLGTIVYILTVPCAGFLADRFGNKRVMLTGALATLICIYPLFLTLLSAKTLYQALVVQVCLALLAAWFQAPMNAYMAKLFPVKIRYSGLALSYNIGIALFGGTTPMICSILIRWTGQQIMPAFYIILISLIGIGAVLLSKPREALA
ncbi:MFS transporter [Candidatus Odyssella thessalonicensis]|uniref:MFS transporter n=1 Tax=Candidatus Odyssella thessalonicensis TaxID=84647 RepID=UPI000225BD8A|nr:MFS transporter [Candidatus Odyssella thessalonicensis]